jgi:hypothetical protein
MVPRTSGHHVQEIQMFLELRNLAPKAYERFSPFYAAVLVLPIHLTSFGFLREKNRLVSFPCDLHIIIMPKVDALNFTRPIRNVG